jgi:hypothetical protein
MNVEELAARFQKVEDQLAIERLQRIFGYYLDSKMFKEAWELFSKKAESIEIADRGVFKGYDGARKFFMEYLGKENEISKPGLFSFHMQHQGVITVNPDGETANGRWYLIMIQARPFPAGGPIRSIMGHGVYENEYVKEDGDWKFKKVFMSLHFRSPIGEGWASIPMIGGGRASQSDAPPTNYHPYPDLKPLPVHWKHPITGK